MDTQAIALLKRATDEIKRSVIGKDDIIIKILMTICSGGHVLLEDIPGVGKTTIATAFSDALGLEYNRMQFTSDVMPADVTGFNIPDRQTGAFEFKKGAVFCNLFLADEINRTSSKTQSALLEAMEEETVTVDGVTRQLPQPFIVLATQNPSGSAGTQLLPESQLDRFMIRLSIGYPKVSDEVNILKAKADKLNPRRVERVMTAQDILKIRKLSYKIHVSDEVYDYIARISAATRTDKRLELGVSPRGSIASASMARCTAMFRGRDYVIPDDVRFVYTDVCAHRVIAARVKGRMPSEEQVKAIVNDIVLATTSPKVYLCRRYCI
jgi:MoxR-like ATPase